MRTDKPLAPETEFATKRPHPHLMPYGMLGRGRLNVTRPVPATQTQGTEARRAALGAWAGVEEVSGVPETSVGMLGGKPAAPASGSAIWLQPWREPLDSEHSHAPEAVLGQPGHGRTVRRPELAARWLRFIAQPREGLV